MTPRFLILQKGWIKMSSLRWGSLGKQFPEVALVKKNVGIIFSDAKSKEYIFSREEILLDLTATNLSYQPVQETRERNSGGRDKTCYPVWALTVSCAETEQHGFLNHHPETFNFKTAVVDFR